MEKNNQQIISDPPTSTPISSTTNNTANPTLKRHTQNLPFIITIGILTFIILGIIIAIFVVQSRQTSSSDDQNPEIAPIYSSAISIQEPIHITFQEDGDINKLISSYQAAIDGAIANKEYELAVTLIDYRTNDLLSFNLCQQAIEILQNTDLEQYDSNAKAIFYSDAMSASISCSATEQYSNWQKQYANLSEEF